MKNASSSILQHLLRPAVRFAIRRGIKVRTIIEDLKNTLIDEAHQELSRTGQDANTSKLSVMTGLQRRDVQKITSTESQETRHADLMTKVIGLWSSSDHFSENGSPRPLPTDDSTYGFNALVKNVSQDINPSTVLFELERLNLVKRDAQGVHLLWNSYQVSGDIDDAYALLSSDIATLVKSVDSNITNTKGTPNLHIATSFDNVSVEAIPEIRNWILERGAAFHKEVREYISSFDKDLNPTRHSETGGARVTVGSFSLSTEPEASDDQ